MVKSRPENSPHYRLPTWEKPSGSGMRRVSRRPMMTGEGFFDKLDQIPQSGAAAQVVERVSTTSGEIKPIRKIRFRKGTMLYAFVLKDGQIIIPRNADQELDLRRETLEFDTLIEVDRENGIEIGKRGERVIKRVGKSRYGAFTVVGLEKDDGKGNIIRVKRLASMTQRRLKRDNEKVRFKEAAQ